MAPNSNEEIARRMLDAAVSGDRANVVANLADDVEMDMRAVPDGALCCGPEEVLAYLQQHREAWSNVEVEITGVESQGHLVAIVFVERAIGQRSGVHVQDPSADLFEFRGASISRITFFDEPADAIAALRRAGRTERRREN
jgi:ketosteroid isomerase-like protein